MFIVNDIDEIRLERPSVVTIGKFDGFHTGHQKLLSQAASDAREGEQLILLTFSASPQQFIAGQPASGLQILSHQEKVQAAEELGIDGMVEIPFDEKIRHISAEDFLEDILLTRLKAAEIAVGPDCSFGYQRRGNLDFLTEKSEAEGFRLKVVEKAKYRGGEVSSSRIRTCLSEGRMAEANAMLGRCFGYTSVVEHGRQLGRKIGFPTINQQVPTEKILPAFGVYAVEVIIEGRSYKGMANVGVKPTVSASRAAGIETHIFDFSEDLYGKTIRTNLLRFIRPEQKFTGVEELKAQIQKDKETIARMR